MSYRNAEHILPKELLEKVQEYADGECLYIPRKEDSKLNWGGSDYDKEGIGSQKSGNLRRLSKGHDDW